MSRRKSRDWRPKHPGDTLSGIAHDLMVVDTRKHGDVAVLIVLENGTEDLVGVWIFSGSLKQQLASVRPAPGAKISITSWADGCEVKADIRLDQNGFGWVTSFIRALGRDITLPGESVEVSL